MEIQVDIHVHSIKTPDSQLPDLVPLQARADEAAAEKSIEVDERAGNIEAQPGSGGANVADEAAGAAGAGSAPTKKGSAVAARVKDSRSPSIVR